MPPQKKLINLNEPSSTGDRASEIGSIGDAQKFKVIEKVSAKYSQASRNGEETRETNENFLQALSPKMSQASV